jgi:hypothetical protein
MLFRFEHSFVSMSNQYQRLAICVVPTEDAIASLFNI